MNKPTKEELATAIRVLDYCANKGKEIMAQLVRDDNFMGGEFNQHQTTTYNLSFAKSYLQAKHLGAKYKIQEGDEE